ncbi:MAG: AsmA-like C-terminal domain-containing protein [Pseudomonadota bacterium]
MRRSPFNHESKPLKGAGSGLYRGFHWALRLGLGWLWRLTVLGVLAVGIGLWRLGEGPVALPWLGEWIEAQALAQGQALSVGTVMLRVGRDGAPSQVSLDAVELRARSGALSAHAEAVQVRFALGDLLQGALRPRSLVVVAPDVAPALWQGEGEIVLDAALLSHPALERLEALTLYRARLDTGTLQIESPEATLTRAGEGWRLDADLALPGGTARGVAEVHPDADAIAFEASLDALPAQAVAKAAGFAPEVLDIALDARLNGRLGRAGLDAFEAEIGGAAGQIALAGIEGAIERLRLAVVLAPDTAPGIAIKALEVVSDPLVLTAKGRTTLTPGQGGATPIGLDLALERLAVDLPGALARPIAFEQGGMALHYRPEAGRVLADLRLGQGALALQARAEAERRPEGWAADLRLSGRDISVAELKAHWPLDAAVKARDWVSENILSGTVPEVMAELRLGQGAPQLGVVFRFEDLVSRYLADMTPIRQASGTGRLVLDAFHLDLAAGQVGEGVRLDGSRLSIADLWGAVTPADIRLKGRGRTAAILGLLDQQPLELVAKLGLDPASVGGTAEVEAALAFPLIADLAIEEVEVAAEADLRATRVQRDARTLTAERLALTATTEAMTLGGRVEVEGIPLDVRWREDYGVVSARLVEATGSLTRERLADLGIEVDLWREGAVPLSLTLRADDDGMGFTAEADLGAAAFAYDPVRWTKPAGVPGRARVQGVARDEGVAIERLEVEAGDLALAGTVRLDAKGNPIAAEIPRFRLGERADFGFVYRQPSGARAEVEIVGERLVLSQFLTDPPQPEAASEVPPFVVRFDLAQVVLTPKLRLSGAKGSVERDGAGQIALAMEGQAGEGARGAAFAAEYSRRTGRPGRARLTTENAGAMLAGLDLFAGARGGRLTLEAELSDGTAEDLSGRAAIQDITVSDATTFGAILEEGEIADEVEEGGLTFGTVEIPFRYRDGLLSLDEAIARSPSLAIKVEGEVDEAADTLDLVGVISPAYALTGFLDEVPVLNRILSGGRGEGFLAMTFQVNGALTAPEFQVNPLSILLPGILRDLFEGRAEQPSQRFLDNLRRDD